MITSLETIGNFKDYKYAEFMRESNLIEGEDYLWGADVEICKMISVMAERKTPLTEEIILDSHHVLWVGQRRKDKENGGVYRSVKVTIGDYEPPAPDSLKLLMTHYWKDFDKWDSWVAHNHFEKIHPFIDLNGRMGRLIWLYKAIQEGYNFEIPFLHQYYYQTLSHYENLP